MKKTTQSAKEPGASDGTSGTKYLRTASVARKLDVTPRTIRRWAASGQLNPRRMSQRCVLFDLSEVERLVEASRVGGAKEVSV